LKLRDPLQQSLLVRHISGAKAPASLKRGLDSAFFAGIHEYLRGKSPGLIEARNCGRFL